MVLVMRDLEAIGKDKKNEQQGFKYRGIDDLYNAVHPILSKHGVFMTAEIVSKTREERINKHGTVLAFTCLRMRYRFVAEDGSEVCTEAEGEGMDSGDKSSNKAMAVAHKYALLQAFCIPTQDLDDPDAQVHEVAASGRTNGSAPAKPQDTEMDREVQDGANDWAKRQANIIAMANRLPDLLMWLDEHGGDWAKPQSGSTLDRLKRKAPEAFKYLKQCYQSAQDAISKKEIA
jgi:hypothetical protein